jgi:transposase InsO family protein
MHVAQCHHPPLMGMYTMKIKILRSDNGGEYTSKELVNFCKYVGIKILNKTG